MVASAEFVRIVDAGGAIPLNVGVTVQLSVIIGGVTFSGSLIAFGKLQELLTGRAITYPLQKPFNGLLLAGLLGLAGWLVVTPQNPVAFTVLVGLSLLLGILSVADVQEQEQARGW